jgi:alkylation response protein AidB-like acyl-CoA dehydrogenase
MGLCVDAVAGHLRTAQMTVLAQFACLEEIREALAPLAGPGRTMGEAIARDARVTRDLGALPLIADIGRLGLTQACSMQRRVAIYEALGHIDVNIAAAAPGPVMTGFVFHALADEQQLAHYQALFDAAPQWSCFALTEPQCGTDAAALQTQATPIDGGWRINGRKYMVGQGATADLVVVFARSAPGPFGLEAFAFCPSDHPGFQARRLPLVGLEGTNLSDLCFENIELPEEARLGRHLKPAQRATQMVSNTLDAMRPCLGAVALGLARAVLDRAEEEDLVCPSWSADLRRRLAATLGWGMRISAARDHGHILSREAGLMKREATTLAEQTVAALMAHVPARALIDHPWLRRATRDVGAFEYMEGLSAIHRLNSASEFRSAERLAGV